MNNKIYDQKDFEAIQQSQIIKKIYNKFTEYEI